MTIIRSVMPFIFDFLNMTPKCPIWRCNQRKYPYCDTAAFRCIVFEASYINAQYTENWDDNARRNREILYSGNEIPTIYIIRDFWEKPSAVDSFTIIDISNKVLELIAVKYDSVKEGVKTVMSGKILEYKAKIIKREGMEEDKDKLSRLITKLMEHNRSQDVIKATQDKQYRNKLCEEYLIGK